MVTAEPRGGSCQLKTDHCRNTGSLTHPQYCGTAGPPPFSHCHTESTFQTSPSDSHAPETALLMLDLLRGADGRERSKQSRAQWGTSGSPFCQRSSMPGILYPPSLQFQAKEHNYNMGVSCEPPHSSWLTTSLQVARGPSISDRHQLSDTCRIIFICL